MILAVLNIFQENRNKPAEKAVKTHGIKGKNDVKHETYILE